jgi:hypothetical protein
MGQERWTSFPMKFVLPTQTLFCLFFLLFFPLADRIDADFQMINNDPGEPLDVLEDITAQFMEVTGQRLAEGNIDEQIDAVS